MGKARYFFLKIDQFIFNKLDQLKNDSSFQKMNDVLLNLNDDQQKVLIQVLVFLSILAPYFIIASFWWSNNTIRSRLDQKNQILEQISLLNGNRDTLMNVSSRLLTTPAIASREEIENKIINIASRYNINSNKVHVVDFNTLNSTSSMAKIESTIQFNDFGTLDFSNFMREIVDVEKFKILKVDLTKNPDNGLLQGKIEIRHQGRNQPQM